MYDTPGNFVNWSIAGVTFFNFVLNIYGAKLEKTLMTASIFPEIFFIQYRMILVANLVTSSLF